MPLDGSAQALDHAFVAGDDHTDRGIGRYVSGGGEERCRVLACRVRAVRGQVRSLGYDESVGAQPKAHQGLHGVETQ